MGSRGAGLVEAGRSHVEVMFIILQNKEMFPITVWAFFVATLSASVAAVCVCVCVCVCCQGPACACMPVRLLHSNEGCSPHQPFFKTFVTASLGLQQFATCVHRLMLVMADVNKICLR